MKKNKLYKLIITAMFIMAVTNSLNSQWVQQNSGTSVFLNSISFTGYNTGYACGFGGLTLKTTNSGTNWITMPTITVTYLYSIYFLTDLIGFTCGTNGKIARTTDGSSWVSQVSGTTQTLRSITFRGSNAGFAVGDNGTILLTTDGGSNWLPPSLDHSGADNYYSVNFITSSTGWVCGYNTAAVIKKSTDGAHTWQNQSAGLGNFTLRDIKFLNSTTGIAVGDGGYIVRTTNGGTNWIQSSSGITNDLQSIDLGSIGLGSITWYAAGFGGKIIKSTNDGVSWGQLTSGTGINLFEIDVCTNSRDTVFACGGQGLIMRTTNGGGSFVGLEQNGNSIPAEYSLNQNYPNPFNPSTIIGFNIPVNSFVTIEIFDMLGRKVSELVNKDLNAGSYNINFNASGLSSGIYFCRFTAASIGTSFTKTMKLNLIK